MQRLIAGMCLVASVGVAVAGCSSSESGPSAVMSRGLTRRLDHAGVCVHTQRTPPPEQAVFASVGVAGAWRCVTSEPTDGGSGGTDVDTWAASNAAAKRRALAKVMTEFRSACSGPNGRTESKSTDRTITSGTAPPEVTLRYVEGDRWLAFVGINAPLRRAAAALGGHTVVRRCG
jgi:hypothetical protein